ncbi:MAG: gamma-glutamyltransferase [Myxococcales bacterium]|nr:gamma-glutamyltransferase [Myxococcales bacterium]HIK85612.1 gamma-glutamyltransferase [Myxococcales bacterium]
MTSSAMIVAPQPEAVEAGALALRRGGNAVDAAITCALVQGVVDPQMCGIAGFGSMQLYLPGRGVHELIDFHGRAPAAATPDMWEDLIEGENRDGFGFVLRGRVNDVGYQSITVPGSLKAYFEAQSQFGDLSWQEVVEPAIAQADEGFIVRPYVHEFWTRRDDSGRVRVADRLLQTDPARAIYYNEAGELHSMGSRVQNPDMARTLRRIADGGSDIFYRGEIADEIVADMEHGGALLSREDLENYEIERSEPLWGEYRGRRISTNPPPGGGIMLVEMLHMLEEFDLRGMGHNSPEYIRTVCEVMKRATIDKDRWVGDPKFFDVPVGRLADRDYAAQLAKDIRAGEVAHVERVGSPESKDTTHVSVVDGHGNAVSMTHSLGMPSGVVTEGLGFMYNGCMGVFDPRPGRANSIEPGKSRFSSLCPSMVFDGDDPVLVIGAPGGTQIAMGVLQAILNVIDHGMTVSEAVAAPRFSATSDAIDVCNRIPRYVTRELEESGYSVVRSPLSYTFASVHGIAIKNGVVTGGADPGSDGMALAVPVESTRD